MALLQIRRQCSSQWPKQWHAMVKVSPCVGLCLLGAAHFAKENSFDVNIRYCFGEPTFKSRLFKSLPLRLCHFWILQRTQSDSDSGLCSRPPTKQSTSADVSLTSVQRQFNVDCSLGYFIVAKYFGSSLLHGDVLPVWVVSVWDIIRAESCVCGSDDGAVSHHPICLPVPDAGAAKCVDTQPEIIITRSLRERRSTTIKLVTPMLS